MLKNELASSSTQDAWPRHPMHSSFKAAQACLGNTRTIEMDEKLLQSLTWEATYRS